ncbi:hypothetical protein ACFL27_09090 [candidate division CSSED10-310 bacterium]|uniref:DUF3368 domain-containing protein n=1 Tax=candidate division CSSED10-310 bacterium TaxID=2855610 RepID=A0ABV6YVV0_UNCC1
MKNEKLEERDSQLSNLTVGLNQRLGKGESETIPIGVEMNIDYVILDDKVARREAERLGLMVKGSLGILSKLEQENFIKIENHELLYSHLIDFDFRIRKDIFDKIFDLNK